MQILFWLIKVEYHGGQPAFSARCSTSELAETVMIAAKVIDRLANRNDIDLSSVRLSIDRG